MSEREHNLSFIEANECLRKQEERYDLLRYTVKGWSIWPLFRGSVANWLIQQFGSEPSYSKNDLYQYIVTKLLDNLKFIISSHREPVLFKTYSSALMEKKDGKFIDVFFDYLITDISLFCKIESTNSLNFIPCSKNARYPSGFSTDFFDELSQILSRINIIQLPISEQLEFHKNIVLAFGGSPFSIREIQKIISKFFLMKFIYSIFLKKLTPRLICIADSSEYPLIAAAKDAGIPIFEFQHGTIYSDNYHYSWSQYAQKYRKNLLISNRFFIFGEYWKKILLSYGYWEEQDIFISGSPRMDHYRSLSGITDKKSNVCKIVITTQGLDQSRVISWIKELLHVVSDKLPLKIWVKLHPVYETDKTPYTTVFSKFPFVSIIRGDEDPSTYSLLNQADLHISTSSTTHYDALGLGIPTILLPFTYHEIFSDFTSSSDILVANSVDELAEYIMNWHHLKVRKEISEYLYISGANNRIISEFRNWDKVPLNPIKQ